MKLTHRTGIIAWAGWLAVALVCLAPPVRAAFDVTFFLVSDTHFKADTNAAENVTLRQRVVQLNGLDEVALPGALGPVGTPRGVIHAGDIMDGYEGLAAEWGVFTNYFGLNGTDGLLNVPVYEGLGNHDQHYPVSAIFNLVGTRNASRPGVTHMSGVYTYPPSAYGGASVTNAHYAWQWGPIHFVNLNMRAGDSTSRYPCAGSLSFLQDYLENVIGDSGAPVFIIHHLDFNAAASDWPAADKAAYAAVIEGYNVIGILHGHLHGACTVTDWNGFRVFKTSALAVGTYVFKITGDDNDPTKATLTAVGRDLSNNTWGAVNSYAITLPPVKQANITNPYAAVNWATVGKYKANLHMHSTQSDGDELPQVMIDAYHTRNYKILAMTDHNKVTWPWTTYGRDPATLGMLAIQAAEASSHAHINSYFSDYTGSGVTEVETTLQNIGARGGIAVFNHPGREDFTSTYYTNLYLTYPHLVGLEVFNKDDVYPNDRKLWDQILTLIMPGRPVWGYANDDAHSLDAVGYSWNTFLLDEFTQAKFREAMTNGQFFFSYAPVRDQPAPVITSIATDEMAGTITIAADGGNSIKWISNGAVINTNNTTLDVRGIRAYIRAELAGPTGTTYTQPFFVSDPDLEPPAAPENLTTTVATSSQVNLTWTDASDNETGFEIERKTGTGGTWAVLDSVNFNVTSYADTTVSVGNTYYYRVRAVNLNGTSGWTAEAYATPELMLPAAPTGLTATVASSTQINLAWTDASDNETGFEVQRKDGAEGIWTTIATPAASAVSYASTGLSASTTYFYRVRAVNTDGASGWSNEASAIILLYGWVEPAGAPATFTWDLDASWHEPGYPNAAEAQATMVNTLSGSRTINITSGRTITAGRIIATETSNASYSWQAGWTLILDNGQANATWTRNKGSATTGALRQHIYTALQLNSTLEANWSLQRASYLDNTISGDGALIINHYGTETTATNRCVFFRGGANTYAGGTTLNGRMSATLRSSFLAEKNSAFGTGDVTVNEWADLTLTDRGATDNMIADTAALRLMQSGTANALVILNSGVNETVNRLYLNGVAQAAGTWGSSASAAEHKNDTYFSGTGVLTVLSTPPPDPDPLDPVDVVVNWGEMAAGGDFESTAQGQAGYNYILERSFTLLADSWEVVAQSGVLGADGPVFLTDTPPAGTDRAFYRIRIVVP